MKGIRLVRRRGEAVKKKKKQKSKLAPVDRKILKQMRRAADRGQLQDYLIHLLNETYSDLPMYKRKSQKEADRLRWIVAQEITNLANIVLRERQKSSDFVIMDPTTIFLGGNKGYGALKQ
jgi:hypothetical protein